MMGHFLTLAALVSLAASTATSQKPTKLPTPAPAPKSSTGDELALFKMDEEVVIDGKAKAGASTAKATSAAGAAAAAVAAGHLVPPHRISGPDPEYTSQAYDHEVEGAMAVECIVGADGHVRKCKAIKTLPFMERAVIDALEARTYAPAELDGKAIDVDYTFHLQFKMPQ